MQPYTDLWTWLWDKLRDIRDTHLDLEVAAEIDTAISKFGNYSWEIGPLDPDTQFVCIFDPNDRSSSRVQEILANANPPAGWRVLDAMPPKAWTGEIEFAVPDSKTLNLQCAAWRCVVYRFPDATYDVVVEMSDPRIPGDMMQSVAQTVVESALGSDIVARHAIEVEGVRQIEDEAASVKSIPLSMLYATIIHRR